MGDDGRVHCRFCSWSVPRWRTLRDGKKRDGYRSLRAHVETAHADEFLDIATWLSEVCPDGRDVDDVASEVA